MRRRKSNLFPLIVAAICFLAAYGLGSAEARSSDVAPDSEAKAGAPCSQPSAP